MNGTEKVVKHLEMTQSVIIVDFRITYTLCIGEVRKPHLPGGGGVYLFFKFTITVWDATVLS